MTWVINNEQLQAASDHLGLRYPVRVRSLEDGPFGMMGKYHGIGHWGPTTDVRLDEPAHHITLKGDLGPYMANTCLLHEMTHAQQCERFLNEDDWEGAVRELALDFGREMRFVQFMSGKRGGATDSRYMGVSYEVEARQQMNKLDKMFQVTELPEGEEAPAPTWSKWRVDLWRKVKNLKKTNYEFRDTCYCFAKDEYAAKKFARDTWGDWSDDADAYLMEEGIPIPNG